MAGEINMRKIIQVESPRWDIASIRFVSPDLLEIEYMDGETSIHRTTWLKTLDKNGKIISQRGGEIE